MNNRADAPTRKRPVGSSLAAVGALLHWLGGWVTLLAALGLSSNALLLAALGSLCAGSAASFLPWATVKPTCRTKLGRSVKSAASLVGGMIVCFRQEASWWRMSSLLNLAAVVLSTGFLILVAYGWYRRGGC